MPTTSALVVSAVIGLAVIGTNAVDRVGQIDERTQLPLSVVGSIAVSAFIAARWVTSTQKNSQIESMKAYAEMRLELVKLIDKADSDSRQIEALKERIDKLACNRPRGEGACPSHVEG